MLISMLYICVLWILILLSRERSRIYPSKTSKFPIGQHVTATLDYSFATLANHSPRLADELQHSEIKKYGRMQRHP